MPKYVDSSLFFFLSSCRTITAFVVVVFVVVVVDETFFHICCICEIIRNACLDFHPWFHVLFVVSRCHRRSFLCAWIAQATGALLLMSRARDIHTNIEQQPASNPLDKRLGKFAHIRYVTATLTDCHIFNFGQYLSALVFSDMTPFFFIDFSCLHCGTAKSCDCLHLVRCRKLYQRQQLKLNMVWATGDSCDCVYIDGFAAVVHWLIFFFFLISISLALTCVYIYTYEMLRAGGKDTLAKMPIVGYLFEHARSAGRIKDIGIRSYGVVSVHVFSRLDGYFDEW